MRTRSRRAIGSILTATRVCYFRGSDATFSAPTTRNKFCASIERRDFSKLAEIAFQQSGLLLAGFVAMFELISKLHGRGNRPPFLARAIRLSRHGAYLLVPFA